MPHQFHFPWFDHRNNTWRRLKTSCHTASRVSVPARLSDKYNFRVIEAPSRRFLQTKKTALWGDHVRPSVCDLVWAAETFVDFHKFRCRRHLQNIAERAEGYAVLTGFCEFLLILYLYFDRFGHKSVLKSVCVCVVMVMSSCRFHALLQSINEIFPIFYIFSYHSDTTRYRKSTR